MYQNQGSQGSALRTKSGLENRQKLSLFPLGKLRVLEGFVFSFFFLRHFEENIDCQWLLSVGAVKELKISGEL